MALQTIQGQPLYWPNIAGYAGTSRVFTFGNTLDAAGEYVATVFRATEAMTISHVLFRTSTTATGSPTVDVRIETVSATTGLPTGTLWATNTNGISAALSTNTVYTVALTASASIAVGDVVAVVFAYNSGTSVTLAVLQGAPPNASCGLPYLVNNAGTPAKVATVNQRVMAVGSSASSFYHVAGMVPLSTAAAQTFSTTNGDAFGNRFKVPFKCRCAGFMLVSTNSSGEFSYGIYNDAGTELSSSSTTFDIDQITGTDGEIQLHYFDNPVTLNPDTWYRIAMWPSSTTNVGAYKWTTATDASEAMPYTNFHYTTKATGGAWTDTATDEALVLDLIIDQLDDGVSTGGGGGLKLAGRGGLAG